MFKHHQLVQIIYEPLNFCLYHDSNLVPVTASREDTSLFCQSRSCPSKSSHRFYKENEMLIKAPSSLLRVLLYVELRSTLQNVAGEDPPAGVDYRQPLWAHHRMELMTLIVGSLFCFWLEGKQEQRLVNQKVGAPQSLLTFLFSTKWDHFLVHLRDLRLERP